MFKFVVAALMMLGATAEDSKYMSICSAANPSLLGKYVSESKNGREAFTNENGFSFFKNREYWYLGDLATWPPETHFRCVDEDNKCHRSENWPAPSAKGGWVMNKRFGTETIPEIVEGPCPDEEEGEL